MQTDSEVPEEWRPIKDYEGWYEVSSFGRVRRVKPGKRTFPGKILRQYLSRRYWWVALYRGGKSTYKTYRIAHLVCTAFHGSKPGTVYQVNHKDLNKSNNKATNLEWVTPSENIKHYQSIIGKPIPPPWQIAYAAKLKQIEDDPSKKQKGSMIGTSKLTESQVLEIKRRLLSKEPQRSIARDFGVNQVTVNRINTGKAWAWLFI